MSIIPYKHETALFQTCKSFEKQKVTLCATFMGETIPISNTNAVGDVLESVFFPHINRILSDFIEGPAQASPDFYGEDGFEFEQKCFTKSPGFDIGNFESYIQQLCKENGVYKKLFKTKYLIYEYSMEGCDITILKFHYLNVWNVVSFTGKEPISMQVKRGMWYNIRPGSTAKWYDTGKTPALFIAKIIECIHKCDQMKDKEEKILNIETQFAELKSKHGF